MIRVGPSRNAAAGGIAAVLSCAGIALCFIGFFFTVTGIALVASAENDAFDDPFFDNVNKGQRIGGIICLVIGITMLVTGIICCVCMCVKANEAIRSQPGQTQGVVISGGPVVTGTVPVGQQYNTNYQQGSGYAPAPYGQPQPATTYPTGTQYPVPGQYPPPTVQYPPPPTNPAYPSQNTSYGTNEPQAPPSYNDVVQKQ